MTSFVFIKINLKYNKLTIATEISNCALRRVKTLNTKYSRDLNKCNCLII